MSALFLEELESAAAPERIAVSDATEAVTYRDLCDQARAVAGWLRRRQPEPGFVLVKAVPDVRFVVTLLGVMYGGGTPVPVDPDLPAPALDFIRTKSQAIDILDPVPRASLAGGPLLSTPSADVPALILFTSGTSGFPKGVIISNANLLASCRAMAAYLEYDRFPSAAVALPLHYSYALLSQVLCQLLIGGRVHLFSDLRNPLKFARTVDELQLQTFCGVPSTYQGLMRFHGLRPIRMPSVRVLCSAGAAMDLSAYTAVKEIFPNATLFNNYGMTEAAPRIAFCRDDDPRFAEATCGRPMAGVEVRIVDPETHDELPDGMRGVLVVRGPNVTSGYLNDPDLSARAFTRDGFLISGDVAYRDNGYLFICGRLDDMFNCGGEKVVPLEIERVLDRLPGVEMSAVAGVPDEQRGMVPAAFVKLAADLTRASLVQHLARDLPISKIPQRFLEVRAFPMTSNGKVQRRRLSVDNPEFVVREIR